MKIKVFIFLLFMLLCPTFLYSQGEKYAHPLYNISFEASPNWTESFREADQMAFSLIHPNHNMEISLAFVADCRRPKKYMRKLSGLNGLVCKRGGYDTILNNQEAVVMKGNCLEGRKSYSTMVIGFPVGHGLYLMQISSPEDCTPVHHDRLKTILETVRVGTRSAI